MKIRRWTAYLAAANGFVLLYSLTFTPVWDGLPWGGYSLDGWHHFVIPHVSLSAVLLALFVASHTVNGPFRLASLLQPTEALTFGWAMAQWPGGDDGGGMGWMLIMGPLTAVPMTLLASMSWSLSRSTHEPTGSGPARTAYVVAMAALFDFVVLLPWVAFAVASIVR